MPHAQGIPLVRSVPTEVKVTVGTVGEGRTTVPSGVQEQRAAVTTGQGAPNARDLPQNIPVPRSMQMGQHMQGIPMGQTIPGMGQTMPGMTLGHTAPGVPMGQNKSPVSVSSKGTAMTQQSPSTPPAKPAISPNSNLLQHAFTDPRTNPFPMPASIQAFLKSVPSINYQQEMLMQEKLKESKFQEAQRRKVASQ